MEGSIMQRNELRELFIKYLTKDSDHQDRRKKDFNQAIFMDEEPFYGHQVFNGTDLDMVMSKFDKAWREYEMPNNDST